MANYTKLDQFRENQAAAEIRKQNISELTEDLAKAKEIYRELPRGTYQAEADRRELAEHIRIISDLLTDERRALSELMGGVAGNEDAIATRAAEISVIDVLGEHI